MNRHFFWTTYVKYFRIDTASIAIGDTKNPAKTIFICNIISFNYS